ncbi:MAG: hypothetical protein KC478_07645 [Bacteriovoracaceae bacterium]|nr:hypothetical protein [Bacteriovoracaceae bacterium]
MRYLLAVILVLFISCENRDEKLRENTLNVALSAKVPTLDSAHSYDTVSAEVVYQIYEPLYEYEYLLRPYTLKPLTAKEMPQVSDNGLTYTIKLKENIYYHHHKAFNGQRELVAQDFINQIKRIAFAPTKSPAWWLFADKIEGLNSFRQNVETLKGFKSTKVQGLKALDKYTLEIKLSEKYPQLLYALAMSFTAPAPMELIEFYQNDLSQWPIGTGAFVFKKWQKNLTIELSANKNYHSNTYPKVGDRYAYENKLLKDAGKSIPFIDGIKFHVIREAQPRMQNFLKGNIDFVGLTKDYFPMALNYQGKLNEKFKKKDIGLQITPTLTYWWLAFNMTDPLVGKNLNLRKAIAHAINNEKLISLFTNNIGLRANSIFPPGIPGYNPSSELPYNYNIEKAKSFLKQAGYPNGKGLPKISYDIRGASSISRQMGEFVKGELKKIGIEIEIITNTFPGFLNKAQTGQLQFWQGGWTMDYPDAENIVQLLTSQNHSPGPNSSYYSNPKVDKLYKELTQLKLGSDPSMIMEKVESEVNKDLPWIMQYYARNYVLYHQRVKNFRQSDVIFNVYKYFRLD